MTDHIRTICRAIIRQAIKDIASPEHYEAAKRYIDSPMFLLHQKKAAFPEELGGSLRDVMLQSSLQRQSLCKEILHILKTDWDD